jgi:hypothetical protein
MPQEPRQKATEGMSFRPPRKAALQNKCPAAAAAVTNHQTRNVGSTTPKTTVSRAQ